MPTSKRPLEHPQYQPHQHTHSFSKLERPLKTASGSSVSRLKEDKSLEMVDEEQRNVNQHARTACARHPTGLQGPLLRFTQQKGENNSSACQQSRRTSLSKVPHTQIKLVKAGGSVQADACLKTTARAPPIPATSAYSQLFQTGKAAKDSLRQLRQSIERQRPKKGRQRQKAACQ